MRLKIKSSDGIQAILPLAESEDTAIKTNALDCLSKLAEEGNFYLR
jgi:hypothetical protein